MKIYRDLDVYKRSYRLAIEMHNFASKLPIEYKRELGDQIRRSSRSIPSNIAEAFGRSKSSKDTINQLRTALGSNDEVLFNIEFLRDVKLMDNQISKKLYDEYTIVGKQLYNLIKSIDASNEN